MSKSYFSLLNWCIVCAVVIFTFAPSLMTERNSRQEPHSALADPWEIGFGPAQPSRWMTIDDELRSSLKGYEGPLWLQRILPETNVRNPHLFLIFLNRFEVFVDGNSLYRFNTDNAYRHINPLKIIHSIPISPQDEGKRLLIRAEWQGEPLHGIDLLTIGEPERVLVELIRVELNFLLYGLLSLSAGIVGMAVYIWSRKSLYGWFSLFSLSMGLSFLFSCRALQWFIDMKGLYYWQELLTSAAIWTCIGFFFNALEVRRRSLIRIVHAVSSLYLVVATVTAIFQPELFGRTTAKASAAAAIAGFAILTFAFRTELMQPNHLPERKWLIRGYWTFTICAIASLVSYTLPGWMAETMNTNHYLSTILAGLLPNGLLLFMICIVMAMISRVRRVYREAERVAEELRNKHAELEYFHRNLEQLVEIRTAELENANRTLDMTLNEKAETMAEITLLEERGRIADEIHDVVGHTLTAAIVQLEATKKLTERQDRIPLDKLDLISELVRKGLEDIRKAVKLMKTDEAQLTLEASLQELIQYTEDTMNIDIAADIALPANLELDKRTEQVVYHALQEGLANGIRQGRCSSAGFSLRASGNRLRFQLISDGEPCGLSAPGHGLSSVMERVKLLGGEAELRPCAIADGTPNGSELSIDLPLD
ncbi:sensor histidine kinase [Paenibacillaceae bacterium WGS1546]|uniref:sensor histidine kinase n=1 Tax=Cohnella sp. WGS1546 TaxID=3366810 RepID=UPI00372D71A0